MRPKPQLGNCWTGAFIVWWKRGGRILVRWIPGHYAPHIWVQTKPNVIWQFTGVEKILPEPFTSLLYVGRLSAGRRRRKKWLKVFASLETA